MSSILIFNGNFIFFNFIYIFTYLFLTVLGGVAHGFSLIVASGAYSFIEVHWLLTMVASPLCSMGSVVAHRLRCSWHVVSSRTKD